MGVTPSDLKVSCDLEKVYEKFSIRQVRLFLAFLVHFAALNHVLHFCSQIFLKFLRIGTQTFSEQGGGDEAHLLC